MKTGAGCLYRLWCWMSVQAVVLDVCKDWCWMSVKAVVLDVCTGCGVGCL